MGAWRYITQDCRRLWRWFAKVGPAEPAHLIGPCARAVALGVPLVVGGPIEYDRSGWLPDLAAPLPQSPAVVWGEHEALAPQMCLGCRLDTAAGGSPAMYSAPVSGGDLHADRAAPSPLLSADVIGATDVLVLVAPDTAEGGSPSLRQPEFPTEVPEPPAAAVYGVAVLAAVVLHGRWRRG